MSLTGSSNMARPVYTVSERGMDPVYSSVKNRNNRSGDENDRKSDAEEEQRDHPSHPLFELADPEQSDQMMVHFPGEGERRVRFLKKEIRQKRGITSRRPVGRVVPESVKETAPYLERYHASDDFHTGPRGEKFQNRM